jgi:hypothetical protein
VTLFGLLFTPTFYAVVRQLSGNASSQKGRIDAPARSFKERRIQLLNQTETMSL